MTRQPTVVRPALVESVDVRRKAAGEQVDAELAEAGHAAMEDVVRKQRDAGIDIGNNGEQQREAFFLYVRSRMSGFGGSWNRPPRGDVERYPIFKEALAREVARMNWISQRDNVPTAIGDVRYENFAAVEQECSDFRTTLDRMARPFVEPFIDRALTRRRRGGDAQRPLSDRIGLPHRSGPGVARGIRNHRAAWFPVATGLSGSGDGAALHLARKAARRISDICRSRGAHDQRRAGEHSARESTEDCVCWGNYEGPHDCDVELKELMPILRQLNVGGFVFPFANPRHAHEYRVLKDFPLDDDQIIVAGVIDSVTNFVEHPETIADRIERVADVVGDPRKVQAGTDCGFDTSAGMRRVAEDVVWAKLASLSEGARIASGRLF